MKPDEYCKESHSWGVFEGTVFKTTSKELASKQAKVLFNNMIQKHSLLTKQLEADEESEKASKDSLEKTFREAIRQRMSEIYPKKEENSN